MRRMSLFNLAAFAAALACTCAAMGAAVVAEDLPRFPEDDTAQIAVADRVTLPLLLDLCVQHLGVSIEYDPAVVPTVPITVQLSEPLSRRELWDLTNQLLAARGLAVVTGPGAMSIVPIAQAPRRVPLVQSDALEPGRGFVAVVTRAQHRPVKSLVDAGKLVLSDPGGIIAPLGDEGLIYIADLAPRVEQAIWVLEQLDQPSAEPTIERIVPVHLPGAALAASLTAVAEARNTMMAIPLEGKVRAASGGNSVLLIAPENELPLWRGLVEQLDQRQPVETRSYAPRHYAVEEVSRLVEQVGRDADPSGSGERWRLVADTLTGTLIVTATPSEHEAIADLIDRLDAMPAASRQPIRAFRIKFRNVTEIIEVLERLVQQGALEGGQAIALGEGEAAVNRSAAQRSERDVLAPMLQGSARPLVPAPPTTTAPSQPGSDLLPPPAARAADQQRSSDKRNPSDAARPATPLLTLSADEATNTLIAVGEPRLLAQLEGLLRVLDVRQPQVMLEAMVISLSDGDTLDLGVELQKIEISGSTIMSLSSIFGLGIPAATSAALPNPTGSGFTGLALNPGDFSVLIRALQTLNNGRSLSMPKVLVNNNQDATLDAVLQQPFTSTNASTTVATTSFGGTQDAGTTITVKPQIAAGDELVLTYSIALSSFVGESSDPNIPPPRQQNSVSSVVRIPDGYTIVVGGLEVKSDSKAVSQVPLLGSIPIVGELFKNRSNSDSTTRFYVFIRAAILRHEDFEDLKYLSDRDAKLADIDDGWPEVKPRVIR